jgi:mRNA interferase HigB
LIRNLRTFTIRISGTKYNMRIISKRSITEIWEKYPDTKPSLIIWEERISKANCLNHSALKKNFAEVDYVPNIYYKHLTVFNIKGNQYRLIVDVFFNSSHIFLKWFGTHADYNRLDLKTFPNGRFRL